MMNQLWMLGMILLAFGCSQEKKGGYYFDYDHVEHYSTNIDEDALLEMIQKKQPNRNEQLKKDIILKDKPEEVSDSSFVTELTKLGFSKKVVSKKKFPELSEIFRSKAHGEVVEYACIHFYRDILVFRKTDSIVGIAKICFSCSDSQIVGTERSTMTFGQSGDYKKLNKLLSR